MSTEPTPNSIETCLACGVPMDLSGVVPLTVVECPKCGSPQTVFQRFGPFKLETLLGTGGMGAVYKATDIALQRPLALKILQRNLSHDSTLTAQFEREAALTARVNHPNVVRVYSTGLAHGMFYIAMELVDGGSLDALMESKDRLEEAEILRIGIQVAEGLQAAHKAGLVHRDIKPGNILFGALSQPKIVDFGLALQSNHSQSPSAEIWGTPFYIAPEALAFEPEDFRSDMYALGATLWHALTGAPPYPLNTVSIHELLHHKKQPADLLKSFPTASPLTTAALNRTIAFNPGERYPDYDSLIADLRSALAQLGAPPANSSVVAGDKGRPGRALPLALFALLTATTAGLWWHYKGLPPEPAALPEPAFQTDRERLSNAIALLKDSAKTSTAVQRLRLIAASPELTPEEQVWTDIALATAHLLGGNIEAHAGALRDAETKSKGATPALQALTALLRAETQGTPGTDPGFPPEWQSLRHLISALKLLAEQKPQLAGDRLKKAVPPAPEGNSHAADLLALSAPLQQELLLHFQIRSQLESPASEEERRSLFKKIDEALPGMQPSLALRKHTEALLKAARERPIVKTASEAQPPPATTPKEKPPQPAPPSNNPAPFPPATTPPNESSAARLGQLREKVTSHVQLFHFREALKECEAFTPRDSIETAQRQRLQSLAGASEALFVWTLQELNRGGTLPSPVLRNGSIFKSDPVSADASKVLVRIAGNDTTLPIPWTDISNAYVLKMAQYRLGTLPNSPQRADLLWQTGCFLLLVGSPDRATAFLEEAVRLKPAYGDLLPALLATESKP